MVGLECQLCKTNIYSFTCTVGLDVSTPADEGLNYPTEG